MQLNATQTNSKCGLRSPKCYFSVSRVQSSRQMKAMGGILTRSLWKTNFRHKCPIQRMGHFLPVYIVLSEQKIHKAADSTSLEVNKSQFSTKLFIFGSAFRILHKALPKLVWAGSSAQPSDTAHKLAYSLQIPVVLCIGIKWLLGFLLRAQRSFPAAVRLSSQPPISIWPCQSFPLHPVKSLQLDVTLLPFSSPVSAQSIFFPIKFNSQIPPCNTFYSRGFFSSPQRDLSSRCSFVSSVPFFFPSVISELLCITWCSSSLTYFTVYLKQPGTKVFIPAMFPRIKVVPSLRILLCEHETNQAGCLQVWGNRISITLLPCHPVQWPVLFKAATYLLCCHVPDKFHNTQFKLPT